MAALTFPLDLADFFEGLAVVGVSFYDDEPLEYSRTGGGEVIVASLGASLWRGSVSIQPGEPSAIAAIEAKLSLLRRPGSSFLIYDPRTPYPAADPDGSILGAATPSLLAVNADARRLSIQGLPVDYTITAGDMISFQYASSPTRYALHRVVVGSTADGAGQTGLIEVTPSIRNGAAAADPVQLIKPYCKAVMPRSPSYGGGSYAVSDGPSFEFIQTLR